MRGSRSRARAAACVVSCGSTPRKSSSVPASKGRVGGNCHRMGPSFGPSANSPEARKLAMAARHSRSRSMWVMKRGAFTVKTKPGGVASAQAAQLWGRCRE